MELKLNGTMKLKELDLEVQVLEGGFGEGNKCLTIAQISQIHDLEAKVINQLINNNIDEFDEGIDIIDLKNSVSSNDPLLELGFTKQSIANFKNIYILSEQGYMTLVTLMRSDRSKQIRKVIRREYFAMREIVNNQPVLPTTYKEALQHLLIKVEENEKLDKGSYCKSNSEVYYEVICYKIRFLCVRA